ncbi:UNVERIFIED_CONTAM: hypothetical protein HDU68_004798 [Siphonaria sp. JEL0065]|nr:hypothetical protein HDU68_004798 [Siphonaria sp. JEL0065]
MTSPHTHIQAASTGGLFPHTHKLHIPKSALDSPPEDGLELQTNEATSAFIYTHQHKVIVTKEELQRLAKGETVVVKDAEKGQHQFEIKL